ncbi:MAG: hypothetical protein CBB97_12350 [Candidatus Endolissoclinum sp. TMED37]|nr:MAG: hypothetical protein CBB97_12350 [Candidatus Endolissoclinum sp. TMED37]|tara:strand:+ start:382 stop:684 length:303 start_codon:yes stop_codon:yes gene_type:complete
MTKKVIRNEDDITDVSIHLTDKILNHFENYISTKDREFYQGDNINKEIPLLQNTSEKPHIKIWFDDEKGNQGSFYSWELQDLIAEALHKRLKIEKEEEND